MGGAAAITEMLVQSRYIPGIPAKVEVTSHSGTPLMLRYDDAARDVELVPGETARFDSLT